MSTVTSFDLVDIGNNKILVNKGRSVLSKSSIVFSGEGNVLIVEDGCRIENSTIRFNANNAIVFFKKNKFAIRLNLTINNDCTFFLGNDCYFNGILNAVLSEQQNILIGDQCLLSFGIWLRNSDAHLIYDVDTGCRVNKSESIIIGDKVWIGQQASILKGSVIGSGSIIGFGSVVPHKNIGTNEAWGGNPAKLIRRNVFWDATCVHLFTEQQTSQKQCTSNREAVFKDDNKCSMFKAFNSLNKCDIDSKINFLSQL